MICINYFQELTLYLLLFQSFFHQPVFQHISNFHVICFGKGKVAITVYVYVMKPRDAGIAAMAVDTVGEGLRHMDALNPPLWCPVRVVCRNVIAALEAEQADLNARLSDPEIFKDYEKAGSLQARAEEIETLLLEKLERWEMLEGKQNGGWFWRFR